ncbi:MAG: integration host factor subunit alpha [Magnetococcales bacterium]|nr:integration host factor subunit alpha [Magnetococcales bacterium]
MTKADIVDVLYSKLDHPRKETQEIVEAMFEMIKVELEKGESIKLPGFGNFVIRSKRSRIGRNPKTGEEMEITARQVLTFKPSTILRNRVQNGLKN